MNSKIIIQKPCHQSWNKMTAEEQGRHCAVCNKVVKDFTAMKTEEIASTLKNSNGEVCGRINIKQLTPANKKQKVYFWINGVFFRKAIYPIMALLGITLIAKKAAAQTTNEQHVKGKVDVSEYNTTSKKITIVIKSNKGNKPIANASISIISGITNHAEKLITNVNGRVGINVSPQDFKSDTVEILITASGYENKTMKLKIVKDIQTIEIRMENEMIIMGEMHSVPN